MGKGDACDVCGGTETRLVDGFYYCAECGTQDTNVRETIVEHTALADGTFAFATRQKFSVKIKDGVQMSSEWHKWHAFNFILAGLTEELLQLGAKPGFKMKVLWVWARFIRKYQNKDELRFNGLSELRNKANDTDDDDDAQGVTEKNKHGAVKVSRSTLATILYLALNLDKSDIQLSHLRRYIQAGQIGVHRSEEYIPKEIETKAISEWSGFKRSRQSFHCSLKGIASGMQQFSDLDLGPYVTPDLEAMVDNLLKELCLPNKLKHLVISLMDFAPVNFLSDAKKMKALPDFEGLVQSYIIVALKMCFGLDDDYEKRLSDAVDTINDEENYLKAYKTDMFAEQTDRLFSFREWCNFLMFRKHILCKNNLSMARERGLYLDDYVYMEHSESQMKKEVLLSDEVTMDIINKIPLDDNSVVIPKSEFEPSTTPLSTLTEVISRHLQEPDTIRLLTEDFTQYSIDYACKDLALPIYLEETSDNIIIGVSESRKTCNDLLGLHFTSSYSDDTMVYVRNCENKNWYKTKRPTVDHIVEVKEANKDSDHGYDSNIENTPEQSNSDDIRENLDKSIHNTTNIEKTPNDKDKRESNDDNDEELKDTKLEFFDEEEEGKNIFDDDFADMNAEELKIADTIRDDSNYNEYNHDMSLVESKDELEDSKVDLQSISVLDSEVEAEPVFDPATFNREETIKTLVIAACQEYKVPIPTKFRPQEPKKRKLNEPQSETGVSQPKRVKPDEGRRQQKVERKAQVNEIVKAYYSNLEKDILHQVSEQVRFFVNSNDLPNVVDDSIDHTQDIRNLVDDATELNNQIEMDDCQDIPSMNEIHFAETDSEHSERQIECDDGSQDPVYKGNPEFDEKTYDAKQLYVKVKGEFQTKDLFDLDSDEEINKLLEKHINQFPKNVADNTSDFDSSDDIPLSKLKKRKKQKRNRDSLVTNPENVREFNYWCKHYISRVFKKHESLERFDAEVRENFPKSFAFVLFECAAVLNCTAHMLYKHVTDIEEKMLEKDGYKRKLKSLKDTGIRIERRDYTIQPRRKRKRNVKSN